MSSKSRNNDHDTDKFERNRRKATGKRRMTPYEVDDGHTDDIGDYTFAEPTDDDLRAIEEDGMGGT
jgi:hypothetical protein